MKGLFLQHTSPESTSSRKDSLVPRSVSWFVNSSCLTVLLHVVKTIAATGLYRASHAEQSGTKIVLLQESYETHRQTRGPNSSFRSLRKAVIIIMHDDVISIRLCKFSGCLKQNVFLEAFSVV